MGTGGRAGRITSRPTSTVLRAYLPSTLIRRWQAYPDDAPVWGEWLKGSLMHCDITGFTAMSERLARLGKEGAEIMADVLNRFFQSMLTIAEEWGGVQMKFGGDAMLLFFSGRRGAAHSAFCAQEMQSAMAAFQRVSAGEETHRLRMRIGVHSGRFFAASLGQADGMLHYLVTGPDVNKAAAVEPLAKPGWVVVSPATAALLGDATERRAVAGGVFRLGNTARPAGRPTDAKLERDVPGGLARYLMPRLAASLTEAGADVVAAEHRRVTAMFIYLTGASTLLEQRGAKAALTQMNSYMKMLLSTVERHGGSLVGSDVAETGDKLIVLFGAPAACEQEEASALRCALDLDAGLRASRLELNQRIGIATGFVFAGEIGSERRREYTVIGDTVNLAARLMAAARTGETIASESTAQRCKGEFNLTKLPPLVVKGKSAPVRAYVVRGERLAEAPDSVGGPDPIFGRESELATLLKLSTRSGGHGAAWALISGEPGIGKSRLVSEFANRLESQGWRYLRAFCHARTAQAPFAPWVGLLKVLLQIDAADGKNAWDALREKIKQIAPQVSEFAELVAELLSIQTRGRGLWESLDNRYRRQHLMTAVSELLNATAKDRPLLVVFEDIHWADASSLELLSHLVKGGTDRLLFCVLSRSEEAPAELSPPGPALEVRLGLLPDDAARQLISLSATLEEGQMSAILARAQGNPLFLREITRSETTDAAHLPETINDMIMLRLDQLRHEEKSVVQAASVIGHSFDLSTLRSILDESLPIERLRSVLTGLTRRGLTNQHSGDDDNFAFDHALAQEVAYEALPFRQRRRLHRDIGRHIEQTRADQLEGMYETLFHHFERAEEAVESSLYGALSGDRASGMFSAAEALGFYERALAALGRVKGKTDEDRSIVLEKMGDCLETVGQHREAASMYEDAVQTRQSGGRNPKSRILRPATTGAARQATLYRKLSVSSERHSDYDGSLGWIEKAIRALPRRPASLRAQVYAAKSVSLFRKGLYGEAVGWGRRALQLARRAGSERDIAYAHDMLGGVYMELGALGQSIRHRRVAVRLYHELGDFPGQAAANNNLGACYQLLGVFDAALYHYNIALEADRRVGDLVDAAVAHNNVGEVLLALGRIGEAVEQLTQVVFAAKQAPDLAALAGLAEVNLSRCHLAQGDLSSSASHLRLGLRHLRKVGAEGLLTEGMLQRAELLLALGKPAAARTAARRALSQARMLDARLLQARGDRLLGEAWLALGRPARAHLHLRTSIALSRQIGAQYEEARSQMALARLLFQQGGRSSRARGALRRASTILSRLGASFHLAACDEMVLEETA